MLSVRAVLVDAQTRSYQKDGAAKQFNSVVVRVDDLGLVELRATSDLVSQAKVNLGSPCDLRFKLGAFRMQPRFDLEAIEIL